MKKYTKEIIKKVKKLRLEGYGQESIAQMITTKNSRFSAKAVGRILDIIKKTATKEELRKFKEISEINSLNNKKLKKTPIEIERENEELRIKDEEKENDLIKYYVNYVKTYRMTPSNLKLEEAGFESSYINKKFKSHRDLFKKLYKENPEVFKCLINEDVFTSQYFDNLKRDIKRYKRFVITTAVSGKEVDDNALKTLELYARKNKAKILAIPCLDVASRNSIFDYELDYRLNKAGFVFKDLYLNDNVFISAIQVSAKQINPTTGLDRIAISKGTMIVGSTKLNLKFLANEKQDNLKALMTTGSITLADYSTDLAMSKRTAYIAEEDHKLSALIVEIRDNEMFFFRQFEFNDKGYATDLGTQYCGRLNKTRKVKSHAAFGDTHVGSHDLKLNDILGNICKIAGCRTITFHDIFDNRFNNHHDVGKFLTRARLANNNKINLKEELRITAEFLDSWAKNFKCYIIKSNHDEALNRYLDEFRWKDDPLNLGVAIKLAERVVNAGVDPLKYGIEAIIGLKNKKNIKWLERDESLEIGGIYMSNHGDKGLNGSKGTIKGLTRAYIKAVIGHSHTAGIEGGIWQVGTSTYMDLGYNSGPSTWTQTMCLIYEDGTRQLINVLTDKNGEKHWKI